MADFVGNPKINLIQGKLQYKEGQSYLNTDFLDIALGKTSYTSNKEVMTGIRPEHMKLSKTNQQSGATFQIFSVLPAGPETYIRIFRDKLFLTARMYE